MGTQSRCIKHFAERKSALYHACCKLLANVLLAIVFLTLLLLDDISKSLFLITTIIDNIF